MRAVSTQTALILAGILLTYFSDSAVVCAAASRLTLSGSLTAIVQKPVRGSGTDAPLIEDFSFLIRDFQMNHQSESNNLNITVRYRYVANVAETQYPDFRLILSDVQDFLTKYPSKADFWEIVNKKLTLMVLKKYNALSTLTIEIQISPSAPDPYLRSSVVTRNRSSLIKVEGKRNNLKK